MLDAAVLAAGAWVGAAGGAVGLTVGCTVGFAVGFAVGAFVCTGAVVFFVELPEEPELPELELDFGVEVEGIGVCFL